MQKVRGVSASPVAPAAVAALALASALLGGCGQGAFPLVGEGAACRADYECQTGYCAAQVCTPLDGAAGRAGQVCADDGDCAGLRCDPVGFRCVACGVQGRPVCPLPGGDGGPLPDGAGPDGPIVDGQADGGADGPAPEPDALLPDLPEDLDLGDLVPDAPPAAKELHVSAGAGDDANPGTPDAPLRTIGEALVRAAAITETDPGVVTVRVAGGTYAEAEISLIDRVDLLGGHDCAGPDTSTCTWSRDLQNITSVLRPGDPRGVVAPAEVTRLTRISGFRIEGQSGVIKAPQGSAALTLIGAPVVSENVIVGGTVTSGPTPGARRSFGILVGVRPAGAGPIIGPANQILGGDAPELSAAIALGDPAGSAGLVADVLVAGNAIHGGAAAISAGVLALHPGVRNLLDRNIIDAGSSGSNEGSSFAVATAGGLVIDGNVINARNLVGSCVGTLPCGGIAISGSAVVTNNVVRGIFAPTSAAVLLVLDESDGPASADVAVVNNYLDGANDAEQQGTQGTSAAVALLAQCMVCQSPAALGRLRNNILDAGLGLERYSIAELTFRQGLELHPAVLDSNAFKASTSGTGGTAAFYLFWNGGTATTHVTIDEINALGLGDVRGNVDLDCRFSVPRRQLAKDSPCIDQGTTTEAPERDLGGDARPLGNGVDIGPDEVR